MGSARLQLLSPEVGSINYVSLFEEFQNQRIGTQLMEKLIKIAQVNKYKTLTLRSRFNYLNFYKRLEFREEGEPFDSLGIPHILMHYQLRV